MHLSVFRPVIVESILFEIGWLDFSWYLRKNRKFALTEKNQDRAKVKTQFLKLVRSGVASTRYVTGNIFVALIFKSIWKFSQFLCFVWYSKMPYFLKDHWLCRIPLLSNNESDFKIITNYFIKNLEINFKIKS